MPITVYYLDDEETLCEIFSKIVSSDEIQVTTFVEADDAIAHCEKTPPDLIIIDYRLRGTTGDIVATKIDENIPKMLVTGDLSVDSVYDFQHIISKPLDFKKIITLIKDN